MTWHRSNQKTVCKTITLDRTTVRLEVVKTYSDRGIPLPHSQKLEEEIDRQMQGIIYDMETKVHRHFAGIPKFQFNASLPDFDLAPGNRAVEMIISAYNAEQERKRRRPGGVHPRINIPPMPPEDPQVDAPFDEVATYRDPPRRVTTIIPPPPTLVQRIINWIRAL